MLCTAMKSLIFATMCFLFLLRSANGNDLRLFSFVGDVVKLFQVRCFFGDAELHKI